MCYVKTLDAAGSNKKNNENVKIIMKLLFNLF